MVDIVGAEGKIGQDMPPPCWRKRTSNTVGQCSAKPSHVNAATQCGPSEEADCKGNTNCSWLAHCAVNNHLQCNSKMNTGDICHCIFYNKCPCGKPCQLPNEYGKDGICQTDNQTCGSSATVNCSKHYDSRPLIEQGMQHPCPDAWEMDATKA